MSDLNGQTSFGKIERMEVELPLDWKYKDEASRMEEDHLYGKRFYFQSKVLNIQSFNIKRFSNINYINNMDSIVDYIKKTVSDCVDGIKFKSGDHYFVVTYLNINEKHGGKKIGQGGFGEVFSTGAVPSLDRSVGIRKYFAIKKISKLSDSAIKEIAYNEFLANKQTSQIDNIMNQKSSYLGCFLRKKAYYIIMDRIEVSMSNVIERIRKENLLICIHEDVLKFIFFRIIEQLAILADAGASHGDIKCDNVMFSYEAGVRKVDLYSADVQLIDFGCSGPNGQSYGGTVRYTPLENWKETTTDKNSKILTNESCKSNQTLDANTRKPDLTSRKHGSKYDTWSTMVSLWEFNNLEHPFEKDLDCGNFLKMLRGFKFDKNELHFSKYLSANFIDFFEKVLRVK